ncbi:uncharacterized protein LOC131696287 isoform X2 [Topomyia yanbarensis]|uniref:uncharacterized protein LOC131696287 isoform X2 n=1 Tax=Topomyia yanbarensis TaxID=2498891 RepID=UPI00273C19EE|nr:uncharacterized protein LOC131696287 isoform X2 [Topomyia yanbarensis]
MNRRNKTCLFCLKQRQILVDDSSTVKAIKKIYNISVPSKGCRICIECHSNISRVWTFKQTVEAASDFDVDSCFVCKSENTINEPGVDRVVDYLIKQCSTIDFGNSDAVRSCVTCLYLLEISIKYEKLAKNYKNAQRFSRQFATMKECNVALWKLDLDSLGKICDGLEKEKEEKRKKGQKRSRGSWGGRDEMASKRLKQEDGSVLPVMLTKLTPTVTPTRTGGKKSMSPNSPPNVSKGKASKQNEKIFIKLPIPRKLQMKQNQQRKKFGAPYSPSKSIPVSPSVSALNRIFDVKLRPLLVKIEHVDLSNYMNRTIAHDVNTRQLRKQKKEEFIGLDDEDVVELQHSSTNIGSSVGKRKSILITERIESPNSAKKKVKFSDSPSIKYVDKLNFSDDEDGDRADSEDEKDTDYEEKTSKTQTTKPQNGTSTPPENGKPRKGRPPKKAIIGDKIEKVGERKINEKQHKNEENQNEMQTNNKNTNDEDQAAVKDGKTSSNKNECDKVVPNGDVEKVSEQTEPEETNVGDQHTSENKTYDQITAALKESGETQQSTADDAMGIEETAEPQDAEMKDLSNVDSPEDVEMSEKKSPQPEDVEMTEMNNTTMNSPIKTQDNPISPQEQTSVDFSSDKEDEIEQVKLSFNDLLGEEISDEDKEATVDGNDSTKSVVEHKVDQEPSTETQKINETASKEKLVVPTNSEEKKLPFSVLDDVDDISDDDEILNQLDTGDQSKRKSSPDLPPLGEDSI